MSSPNETVDPNAGAGPNDPAPPTAPAAAATNAAAAAWSGIAGDPKKLAGLVAGAILALVVVFLLATDQLFFDQFSIGISRGVLYALVALGLVLIYRTTGLINFAQGEMALFSTFITYELSKSMPIVVAVVASAAIGFVGGALVERVVIRPVEGAHNPLSIVIVTLGMFLAINSIAQLIFIKPGQEALRMTPLFPGGEIVGIRKETVGFAFVLLLQCVLLYLLLQKTKVGLALRGVASNPASAQLVGIRTGTILMVGWGLAAGVGAVGGSLAAMQGAGFDSSLMQQVLVYAFAAAALGGFDSMVGAVVGGLIVGVANALTIEYIDFLDDIELVLPFLLIVVVLLVRPNGLFGRKIVERV